MAININFRRLQIQAQKSELLELALNDHEQYETILESHTTNKKQ